MGFPVTPEEERANSAVHTAITDHTKTIGPRNVGDDEHVLESWVLVSTWVGLKSGRSHVTCFVNRFGNQVLAKGMLHTALYDMDEC